LDPETSEQMTVTLKADIPIDSDDISFDFAITYFDIDIKSTINSVDAGFIMERCYNDLPGLASQFCPLVGARPGDRPATSAFVSSVDASFVNIGAEVSTGYDFNTRLGLKFDEVDVVWTVQATLQKERSRTIQVDERLFNNGTADFVGTYGTPDWRAVTQILVTFDDFSVAYTGRYIAETERFIRDPANPTTAENRCIAGNAAASTRITGAPLVYLDCTAESAYTSDISLTWAPEDADFSATIGVSNFTDEAPAQVSSGQGNDRGGRMTGSGYDQVGRSIFAFASYKF
jgi:iron complex outermembrane receptor protein